MELLFHLLTTYKDQHSEQEVSGLILEPALLPHPSSVLLFPSSKTPLSIRKGKVSSQPLAA